MTQDPSANAGEAVPTSPGSGAETPSPSTPKESPASPGVSPTPANSKPEPPSTSTAEQNSTQGSAKYWRAAILLFLFLPIVIYLIALLDRRVEEMRRFHQEMLMVEKELIHSLDAAANVVVASTLPSKIQVPAGVCNGLQEDTLGELAANDDSDLDSIVQIQPSLFTGEILEGGYRACSVRWIAGTDELRLRVLVDRPNVRVQTSLPRSDDRYRYRGEIDLGKRLRSISELSNFDALVIADARGEVILKYGPSADLISALPLTETEWSGMVAANLSAPKTPQDLLVSTASVGQVEREVAGRQYTLFSRQILLRPKEMLGPPLDCRFSESPATGQETLRLRAVGLVQSSRLTASAIRPGEKLYWFFFLFYLAVFFLLLKGIRFQNPMSKRARAVHMGAALGFGCALGLLSGLLFYLWIVPLWEESQLRQYAEEIERQVESQYSAALLAIAKNQSSCLIERFSCFENMRMASISTGQRLPLQPITLPPRDFLKKTKKQGDIALETVISYADGRKTTVLAKREEKVTKAAALQLVALHRAHFLGGFGAALVGAETFPSSWGLLADSESRRQTNEDFLSEFSDPDCLRLAVSQREGFCFGRLRGQEATLLIKRPAKGRRAFERFVDTKLPAIVVYAYQDPNNAQLQAITTTAFYCLGFISLAIILVLVRAVAPEESSEDSEIKDKLRRWWIIDDWWILSNDAGWYRRLSLAGVFLSVLFFLACWWMEDWIYRSKSACDQHASFKEYQEARHNEVQAAGLAEDVQKRAKTECEGHYKPYFTEQPSCNPSRSEWSLDLYQWLRPDKGRMLASGVTLSQGLIESAWGFRWAVPRRWMEYFPGVRLVWISIGAGAVIFLIVVFAWRRRTFKSEFLARSPQLAIAATLALALLAFYKLPLVAAFLAVVGSFKPWGSMERLVEFGKGLILKDSSKAKVP